MFMRPTKPSGAPVRYAGTAPIIFFWEELSCSCELACQETDKGSHFLQVIPNTTLRNLFATLPVGETILRWRLNEQIAIESGAGGTIKIIMTIETWKGVSLNPGAIRLHFLELHQATLTLYEDGMYNVYGAYTTKK